MKAARTTRIGLAGTLAAAAGAIALATAPGAGAGVSLDPIVTQVGGSFSSPVHVTSAPGYDDMVFVTERSGDVRIIENGNQRPKSFLDITDDITHGGEQGLLSIAFPPDYEESGLFYAYFTNKNCSADGCNIEVAEFKRRNEDSYDAKERSWRTVIEIPHKDAGNHNGGTAAFGPDGKLWIATGDGGSGGDEFDNARRLNKLLGKLLRINPKGKKDGDYRIPADNPFVGRAGRDEIWSIGLRNPFRFSFDGDNIAIGDVGQGAREEVDIVPIATAKGADFQWPAKEGFLDYDPGRATALPQIPPVHDYPRPVDPPDATFRGVSVIGGVFPRDPDLDGTTFDPDDNRYFFAEAFTSPNSRSLVPNVGTQTFTDLRSHDFNIDNVAGIGEDNLNQIYIASLNGTVHRLDPPPIRRQGPPIGDGEGDVDLVQVGGTFNEPVNSTFAPGETDKVYVVEQDGTARVVVGGTTQGTPFLDITDRTDSSGEQGFLSMAFHPNFAVNGLVYAYYTDEDNGDIVVDEFETNSDVDADESSRREVIRIRHRFAENHNGGQIAFGPDDGYMYISTGDGGSGDDPRENAQDKESLLGKLIRIDPLGAGDGDYTVPGDNPYVGKNGDDEIYAIGLRNPFRFNFEPETGNIMIGDVGQNRFEEIDIESEDSLRKANFGWDRYEGFKKSNAGDTASGPTKKKHDKPVLVYDHGEGASVIGGVVVHDPSLTNLFGRYLFTDYFADRLRSFEPSFNKVDDYVELDTPIDNIAAISEDPSSREVYITSLGDEALYRLEPAP